MHDFENEFTANLRKVIVLYREKSWEKATEDLHEMISVMDKVVKEHACGVFSISTTTHSSDEGNEITMMLNRHHKSKPVERVGAVNQFFVKKDGTYPLFFITPRDPATAQLTKVQIDNRETLFAISMLAFRDPKSEIIRLLANHGSLTD